MAKRPPHVKPPAYLSPNPPVPKPALVEHRPAPGTRDPVRYGDWERDGIAVDF